MAQYPFFQNQQFVPQVQQYTTPTIVSVRSEAEARNYPVGLGNSVIFKDENQPFIYSKAMGYSQLDRPTFEKYRLVKEEIAEIQPVEAQTENDKEYALKSDLEPILEQIKAIQEEMKKAVKQTKTTKETKDE